MEEVYVMTSTAAAAARSSIIRLIEVEMLPDTGDGEQSRRTVSLVDIATGGRLGRWARTHL